MKNIKNFNNSMALVSLMLLVFTIFWSGILRDDATPYGDGSRIAPFIKMFDHHESAFPMWGPRNGGEPLLASPERFYLLGYLLDWGESSNFLLNLILFLSILFLTLSGFLLARALDVNKLLSSLYALSLTINGFIIETERSARFQAISIFTLTILVSYLYISKNKYSHWLIPILIALSIYNGIHYAALTIVSFVILAYFREKAVGVTFAIKSILRGGGLSLPFLLPVILHPIFNGANGLEDLKYDISTVSLRFLVPTTVDNLRSFLGYQIYLFIPLLVMSYKNKQFSSYWLLAPIVPWSYLVLSHYFPEIKNLIESTVISNWRHNTLFYEMFLVFGYLFIVKSISNLPLRNRKIFSVLFVLLMSITFVTLYDAARSEYREKDNKLLHLSNTNSPAHKLLESNGLLFESEHYRVYYSGHGMHLPESRVFQGFSYFMINGFSALLDNLDSSDIKLRPHWSSFKSPCDGFNIPEFSYAGYAYLICKHNLSHDFLESEGFSLIGSLYGNYLYEKSDKTSFGDTCKPGLGVSDAAQFQCKKRVRGEATYMGNSIDAQLAVEEKTTVFFHENFAWGWLGTINGELRLPSKVNDIFLGYELETGEYEIRMYYVDPFFVLGFLLLIIYFVVERYLINRARFSSLPCETH